MTKYDSLAFLLLLLLCMIVAKETLIKETLINVNTVFSLLHCLYFSKKRIGKSMRPLVALTIKNRPAWAGRFLQALCISLIR